ncbi:heme uptake protein IsdC [Paenibacillus nanensis]|uniref:heme uptake protein IsdC n=1 Tax=Paenibacillus nanensis TaxID=393251 RepID=UPI0013C30A77|nr:heme uptake protein IsdC [Paenibacillus nanensis]
MTKRIQKAAYGLLVICLCFFGLSGAALASAMPEDGAYEANYVVLQADNDNVSMANDYWEKPAKVTIKNGKATVRLSINHSKWVTEFKVPSGSSYADAKVVVSNKKDDIRTVEFSADITSPIISKIHVTVPDIDYDHDYTIRLVFDLESLERTEGAKPSATEEVKPTATAKPSATAKPTAAAKPSEKPASAGEAAETAKPEAAKKPAAATAAPSATVQSTAGNTAAGGTEAEGGKQTEASGSSGAKAETEPAAEAGEAAPTSSPAPSDEADTGTPEADQGGGGDGDNGTEQAGESTGAEAADIQTASAEIAAEGDAGGVTSSGMIWWTPLAVGLLLAGGGTYVWKKKRG